MGKRQKSAADQKLDWDSLDSMQAISVEAFEMLKSINHRIVMRAALKDKMKREIEDYSSMVKGHYKVEQAQAARYKPGGD